MLFGHGGHRREIGIDDVRRVLRRQTIGNGAEFLDIRIEHRELHAFGGKRGLPDAAEHALVDMGRDVTRDFHGNGGQKIIGGGQFLVHRGNLAALPALQRDACQPGKGEKREIDQQILEREDVRLDRLGDRDLLDAAHITDLPVFLRAVRVFVVAGHANLAHDHGRCQFQMPVE